MEVMRELYEGRSTNEINVVEVDYSQNSGGRKQQFKVEFQVVELRKPWIAGRRI